MTMMVMMLFRCLSPTHPPTSLLVLFFLFFPSLLIIEKEGFLFLLPLSFDFSSPSFLPPLFSLSLFIITSPAP